MVFGHHRVNGARVRALLEESAALGRDPGRGPGLHRPALSPADLRVRAWVRRKMEEAGLQVHVDGALNLHGVLPAASIQQSTENDDVTEIHVPARRGDRPRVVTGSHMDSVIGGGHLDGALGVIAGIECLRRVQELRSAGAIGPLLHDLEVIDFTDEEGRFGGMLGSMCIAGGGAGGGILSERDILAMSSTDSGERVVDLLVKHCNSGDGGGHASEAQAARNALASAYPPNSIKGFVELHIEQGPVLDAQGEELAVEASVSSSEKRETLPPALIRQRSREDERCLPPSSLLLPKYRQY